MKGGENTTQQDKKTGNKWVNFVKDWADDNDTTYMCAIAKPELKKAYKEHKVEQKSAEKKKSFQEIKDAVVSLATERTPVVEKKRRGRPSKYATEEEKKQAKKEKTLASTRKIRAAEKERATKAAEEEKQAKKVKTKKVQEELMTAKEREDHDRMIIEKMREQQEKERIEDRKRAKEREEERERKRIKEAKDRELIITPTEVKKLLDDPKRKNAWVKINNTPTMVKKPEYHPNRREYPDPYGYDIENSTILESDVKVYPFRYFLPNHAYKSWGNTEIWYDPDTLQPLGQVKSIFDYNEKRPKDEKLSVPLLDNRKWVFIPTPLGKIRLKEYMK